MYKGQPNGEDGSIQGLLQLCKIPYVGNGVMASALAMDKVQAKALFRDVGLEVASEQVITRDQWEESKSTCLARAKKILKPDAFVKPSRSGSSVGVSLVLKEKDLEAAIELALSHDQTAMVERRVLGREIECVVLVTPTVDKHVSDAGALLVHGRPL